MSEKSYLYLWKSFISLKEFLRVTEVQHRTIYCQPSCEDPSTPFTSHTWFFISNKGFHRFPCGWGWNRQKNANKLIAILSLMVDNSDRWVTSDNNTRPILERKLLRHIIFYKPLCKLNIEAAHKQICFEKVNSYIIY